MFVILGSTGHVGSAVAEALLEAGERVLAVTRDEAKAAKWRARGAEVAVVDVRDADALRAVFRRGRRAFLLNPPADPAGDTDTAELETIASIVAALDDSGLEKVVAASTYGARPGTRCGDLTTLHAFEQALADQPVPAAINRGAYYMSNWDGMLESAREGVLPSMLPADLVLPMVAPVDLGRAAARRLREPTEATGLRHVEGPERYTPADVADAFAQALGRDVELAVTPLERLEAEFRGFGFSPEAAESYACMTRATAAGPEYPDDPERGQTRLQAYIESLVAASPNA